MQYRFAVNFGTVSSFRPLNFDITRKSKYVLLENASKRVHHIFFFCICLPPASIVIEPDLARARPLEYMMLPLFAALAPERISRRPLRRFTPETPVATRMLPLDLIFDAPDRKPRAASCLRMKVPHGSFIRWMSGPSVHGRLAH